MRRFLIIKLLSLTFVGLAAFFAVACENIDNGESDAGIQNRQTSVQQRQENFARAVAKYPQPQQENFPLREALVKFTERQDLLNHPWYIYVANECFQCPNGLAYQYYIGQTYPISTCNFLGSTEEVQSIEIPDDNQYPFAFKFQAPSLDGIFYGSGQTSGGCDYFFFDVQDDGMVVLHHDWTWFIKDRPLLLDAKLMVSPK